MTIKQYTFNRETKNRFLYRYFDGKGIYIIRGVEFSEAEIDQLFPTPEILNVKDNSDRTRLWMGDKKSY